jgi:putative metallohydrolase (TIGR04338 family)
MTADRQRTRVYDAEALVRRMFDRSVDYPVVDVAGSHLTLPPERRFASLESVQRYVDAVLGLRWVRERWPRADVPVSVRSRAGQSRAHYERFPAVIAVPLHEGGHAWALRELVVLHEVGEEAAFLLRVTLLESGAAVG